MSSGLIALLDDVAAIAKLAAASIDDVGAAAGKAGAKAAGVVIDDAAVTPRYVVGLSPQRELPIIGKIAVGSIRNKLLFLLPAALLLAAFAPWVMTPLLMLGGTYLAFEGAEKILHGLLPHEDLAEAETAPQDPAHIEKTTVAGAVRTDFILSAEIMAIALNDVADRPLTVQAAVLVVVALAMTAGVYGAVALIVKMDDVGLHLAEGRNGLLRSVGRGLVKAMPVVMSGLQTLGTAAMLWVGGGILVHGLHDLGVHWPSEPIEHLAHAVGSVLPLGGIVAWLVTALASAVVGLIVGAVVAGALQLVRSARGGGAQAH
ncbi:DUF808 domain-containing protein [Brevundimonas sp. VNH65]|uniref:DUF808 domain-containing protein n=1 Tax=Brevundimonas sp. VNH65 TaxID=3400917 RepID=UPI003C01A97F